MKTCPNCGNQVADEVLFCNNCGTSLANVAATTENKPVEAAPTQAAPQVQAPTQQQPFMGAQQPFGNTQQGAGQPFMNGQPGMNDQFMGGQANFQQPYPQPVAYTDPSDHTSEFDPEDIKENKLFAILPYFFFVFGVIACLLRKDSKYCLFHAKNAIRLELASLLACLLMIIPVLGWIAGGICLMILVVVNIMAIVFAFQGRAKDLPVVSGIKFLQ
jgi:uncharacterized membrane protein